jgi:hypothetical protein
MKRQRKYRNILQAHRLVPSTPELCEAHSFSSVQRYVCKPFRQNDSEFESPKYKVLCRSIMTVIFIRFLSGDDVSNHRHQDTHRGVIVSIVLPNETGPGLFASLETYFENNYFNCFFL